MNAQRYPEEFRIEAVKQVLEHGHSEADESRRRGLGKMCHRYFEGTTFVIAPTGGCSIASTTTTEPELRWGAMSCALGSKS